MEAYLSNQYPPRFSWIGDVKGQDFLHSTLADGLFTGLTISKKTVNDMAIAKKHDLKEVHNQ